MSADYASKDEFLTALHTAWDRLQQTIHDVEQRGHSGLKDDAGWTPSDHLSHLAAWLRSVNNMVKSGKPQWETLGVERVALEDAMTSGNFDHVNEQIRQQEAHWSTEYVIEQLTDAHEELIQLIDGLSDKQLAEPAFAFAEGGGTYTMLQKFTGDSSSHYDEHREYIERLLAGDDA